MALKDTIHNMNMLLGHLVKDLEKAAEGNRAASQRVRTGSIQLEKVAKHYRKESVAAERGGTKKGGAKKSSAKPAAKKAAKPAKKAAKPAKRKKK